jgi:iron-sulfur cluster repair protein YtfE (RIC family)
MYLNRLDNYSQDALTPEGLCNLIQMEYQPEIAASCATIEKYFSLHPYIKELPLSVSELTQLLFGKLNDELKHLFLKETGIVFPCIRKSYHGTENVNGVCLDAKVFETVHNTHQIIIGLTQKIRHLLNNFVVKSNWSKDWKICVNELFLLESKILQWIHVEQNLLYPKVVNKNKTAQNHNLSRSLNSHLKNNQNSPNLN